MRLLFAAILTKHLIVMYTVNAAELLNNAFETRGEGFGFSFQPSSLFYPDRQSVL